MMQVKVKLMIPSVSLPHFYHIYKTKIQCCNMVNSLVLPDCKPKYQRSWFQTIVLGPPSLT